MRHDGLSQQFLDPLGESFRRAQTGELAAREELFETHLQPIIRQYLSRPQLRAVRPTFDEQDLMQEVSIKIWHEIPRFRYRGIRALKRWIYCVVHSELETLVSYDHAAKRDRRRMQPLDGTELRAPPTVDQAAESELQAELMRALPALSKLERELFERVDLRGEPIAQVAREHRIPHSTARHALAKARARLAFHFRHHSPR